VAEYGTIKFPMLGFILSTINQSINQSQSTINQSKPTVYSCFYAHKNSE